MRKIYQIAVAVIFVAISTPAQAWFVELDRPGLALPEDFRKESRKEIQQVLEHPDCKFLGGSALNWNTALRYAGSTKNLNLFLHALSNCEGAIIQVSFVESLPEDGDWHVHHSAHERGGFVFHVRISMASDKINLVELTLPEIRGTSNAEPQR